MLLRTGVIIVLGFLAYASMLPAPFRVMDDRISIIENPLIQSLHNIPKVFQEGYFHDSTYYRPLVNLSFMLEYHFFGLNSFYYNLDNLILHLFNALLVFLLVFQLTQDKSLGFWTGLLFVLHPVQWEAVCNVPGRAILLSAFFELSTFILFLYYYKNRRWFYLPLMLFSFFLALLCKESAGVLPLVIVGYLFLDKGQSQQRWLRLKDLWPLAMALGGYLFLRQFFGITQLHAFNLPGGRVLAFVTFLRSVITDLRLFILPMDLHDDRSLPLFSSLISYRALWTLAFWGVAIGLLVKYRRSIDGFVLFLITWFALELFPVSQLVSSIQVGEGRISTAEHFLYLASIPVFIGMIMAFKWILTLNARGHYAKPFVLKYMAGGFLVFLFVIALEQSIYAKSEFDLVDRSLSFDPGNPRLQGEMALMEVFQNNFPEAQRHFELAIKADPYNPKYHIALGTTFCREQEWIKGLEQLVALDPGQEKDTVEAQAKMTMMHIQEQLSQGKNFDSKGWLAIGIYDAKHGLNPEALDAFSKSAALDSSQVDAWFNLASIEEAQKDWSNARTNYQKVLSLDKASAFQKDFASKHLSAIEGK